MRITWLSNAPWTNSGYGQQTKMFAKRLTDAGHDIAVVGYFGLEGGVLNFDGYTVFPKFRHPYANDIFISHSQSWGAQIGISLMDTWVMEPENYPVGFHWVPWYPVDHEPMPNIVRSKIGQAFKRIAMSRFGERMTHLAGLDCYYVPHGIETATFKPYDKMAMREELKIPKDKWVVGTVAMNKGNPSRKNFYEMVEGFADFKKSHKDAFYFLQTDKGEHGTDVVNLPELLIGYGLAEGEDYMFCNQYNNIVGFPPEYMAKLYSALDVHMLVSAGEGFGIPTIEAQACGCPVIVGDWTASSELCFSGHKIDRKDAQKFWTGLAAFQYRPHTRAIARKLALEYKTPTPTAKTIEHIKAEYDADVVMEKYWKPVLAEIEAVAK